MAKISKKLAFVFGALTAVVLAGVIALIAILTSFSPKSTGKHEMRNALKESIEKIGVFKDGNMYYCDSSGNMTLVAENAYSESDSSPVFTADYGIDKASGKLIYLADGKLYSSENGEITLIASNVSGWRTFEGMDAVAFTTKNELDSSLGTLFLYKDGNIILLDTGVTVSSVRFSQKGNCLFAEKPNIFPKIRSKLMRYDLSGNGEVMLDSSMPVMWVSDNGGTVICGSSVDDSLYTYEIYGRNFKKKLTLNGVYYPAVSDDGSILYVLCDYDTENKQGVLKAIDLVSLKEKVLAENAGFFTADALCDNSKGVVYSVVTDSENGLYSIYYCPLKGKAVRLIRNTDEDAMYGVAIDTKRKSGYILAPGKTKIDTVLYYITLKGGNVTSARVASGFVDSLVYYEESGLAAFVKNPDTSNSELYIAQKGETVLAGSDIGAKYNGSSNDYTANAVLSSKGDSVLYLTDLEISDDGQEISGTLKIKSGENEKTVSENVNGSYMLSPVANGDFTDIFYCRNNENKYDVCFFDGTETRVLVKNADGIFEIS